MIPSPSREGDEIESRLSFKIFSTLMIKYFFLSDPCDQLADFRAQQCQHLFEVVSMDYLAVDLQLDQVPNYSTFRGSVVFI